MNLEWLEQFEVIAHNKSMRIAAEKLYMTQSSLSRNLRELENELGVQLFERSRKQLQLNNYGQILLKYTEQILSILRETRQEIQLERIRQEQILNLGCYSYAFQSFVLPKMANQLKHMVIKSNLLSNSQMLDGLQNQSLDLAICTEAPLDVKLEVRELFQEKIYVSVPAAMAGRFGASLKMEDLSGQKLIFPEDAWGYTEWFQKLVKKSQIQPAEQRKLSLGDYIYEKDDGETINLTTSFILQFMPATISRVFLPVQGADTSRSVYLVWRKKDETRLKPVLECFSQDFNRLLSGNAFLAYFLFPGKTENLIIDEAISIK